MTENQCIYKVVFPLVLLLIVGITGIALRVAAAQNLVPHMVVKGQSGEAFYYVGEDDAVHPFLHPGVFFSYSREVDDITFVSDAALWQYPVGQAVCLRAGSWLVQLSGRDTVYAVEPGCTLRPIRSEIEAYVFYGKRWEERVVTLDEIYFSKYRIRNITEFDRIDDVDRDGLSHVTEIAHETSDTEIDSDNDGLSDYEEVRIWLSDPATRDTDGDGVADGQEVLQGRSPNGPGTISYAPERYDFPRGTIFYNYSGRSVYYAHPNGDILRVSGTSDDTFSYQDGIHTLFTSRTGVPFDLDTSGSISADDPLLTLPVRRGTIEPL